ncbi:protocadherin gamma-A4 [Alligator sinensis]|uniref:Protocadherin gamma-A4 n=1 Tax=Alligator sinensis TaxID=38654 RepID=A0A3Q0FT85_ALLSI|nr:protocadherin gamma-A4 [Alligator sinensis]
MASSGAQGLRRCAGRAVLCCVVLAVCGAAAAGQIRYSIPEEMQKGSFVGNIAQDLGLEAKALSERGVRVISRGRTQYFALNVKSGHLITAERLDREQLCGRAEKCLLNCEVIVEHDVKMYGVEVEIVDINDNAPSFQTGEMELKVSELTVVGTKFPLHEAHDPDLGLNSLQKYQLQNDKHFFLDLKTRLDVFKRPELVLQKPLDREEQAAHDLILTATDGGDPVRSGTARIHVVVLDANDNAPVFSQPLYRVSVRENVPVGTTVATVKATDLDEGVNGEVIYTFQKITELVSRIFHPDSGTGDITTAEKLDFEEASFYEMEVQAHDGGGLFDTSKVVISVRDVNDNVPEIRITSLLSSVPEDSPPGTVIALLIVQDQDAGENGAVTCTIPDHVPFRLQKSLDTYYTLVTARDLDREQVADYNVTVTARDRGAPPLWSATTIAVQVSDVNDNAPAFSQAAYSVWVSENNARGASVFCARAADADWGDNARVTYWLAEGELQGAPLSSWLSVQAESGAVHALRALDYEQKNSYTMKVEARDGGGLSSSANVKIEILDENDNAPEVTFTSVSSPVPEDSQSGTVIALIHVNDPDSGQNGEVACRIPDNLPFKLVSSSKNYYKLVTAGALDRERSPDYNVTVTATDKGAPPLATTQTVRLQVSDVNDNAPLFDEASYSAYVAENNPAGASLLRVRASDPDLGRNGRVTYSLVSPDGGGAEDILCRDRSGTLLMSNGCSDLKSELEIADAELIASQNRKYE